ncbi:MAG TPA: hypothetical protein VFW66_09180 [Gemmatimonadales bacterium]|nr:hypothetical protein [Gemmatimonadales bacterium]
MHRALASAILLVALAGCRAYDVYPRISSQKGLTPADQWARYGHEEAEVIAIGRAFAQAHTGNSLEELAHAAGVATAYARTMPDVVNITVDTLGSRLTVKFKSGWRTAVVPVADGERPADTPDLPPGAGAAGGKANAGT